MRCYIIRHAEKEQGDFYNPALRHQDEPLSQTGQLTARNLSGYFEKKPICAIYVSGYQRTRQTIEYLAQGLHLMPILDERLNEIDNGLFERLREEEIQCQFPDLWNIYRTRTRDFRFPEGETGEEVKSRIMDFLEQKRRQHINESIILVSHDGLIRSLVCGVLGMPVYQRWNLQTDFGGITEIVFQPEFDAWKLVRFNQTCP
jgi:broad specificity phosphatase PhoE